jgi:hypothetical protein
MLAGCDTTRATGILILVEDVVVEHTDTTRDQNQINLDVSAAEQQK